MINLDSVKLQNINKPGRYVGGEINQIIKNNDVKCSVVLCYPNIYEKAMSPDVTVVVVSPTLEYVKKAKLAAPVTIPRANIPNIIARVLFFLFIFFTSLYFI